MNDNPFTAPLRILTPLCDCSDTQAHDESCPATPIFAELSEELDSVYGLMHDFTYAAITRHAQFKKWWGET